MANLVFWDQVLWFFMLGFTPLALSLVLRLISSVGGLLWYRHSQNLQQASGRGRLCPHTSARYRILGR